jgi:hypothetical protein
MYHNTVLIVEPVFRLRSIISWINYQFEKKVVLAHFFDVFISFILL